MTQSNIVVVKYILGTPLTGPYRSCWDGRDEAGSGSPYFRYGPLDLQAGARNLGSLRSDGLGEFRFFS